jgi:hypothetical protein
MSYPEAERRRAKRQEWIVDIYFDGSEGVGIAQTRNISAQGLYFDTLTVIPKGVRLKLRLPINPEAKEYLVVEAVVAYSQPGVGVGVEFVDLDEQSQERLERFINENRRPQKMVTGGE